MGDTLNGLYQTTSEKLLHKRCLHATAQAALLLKGRGCDEVVSPAHHNPIPSQAEQLRLFYPGYAQIKSRWMKKPLNVPITVNLFKYTEYGPINSMKYTVIVGFSM
jgi:hypothetical protein